MTCSQTKTSNPETVLVVHTDPNVLVLVNAVLAESHRVLLAHDIESAARLMAMPEPPIDLVLIDRGLSKRERRQLRDQIAERRPAAGIGFLSGVIEDGVIKLTVPAVSRLQEIVAAARRAAGRPGLTLSAGMSF